MIRLLSSDLAARRRVPMVSSTRIRRQKDFPKSMVSRFGEKYNF